MSEDRVLEVLETEAATREPCPLSHRIARCVTSVIIATLCVMLALIAIALIVYR